MSSRRQKKSRSRKYPWQMYVFVGAWSLAWVIGVPILGEFHYAGSSSNPVRLTPSETPVVFWGSIVFFAAVFVIVAALGISGERQHRRERQSVDAD